MNIPPAVPAPYQLRLTDTTDPDRLRCREERRRRAWQAVPVDEAIESARRALFGDVAKLGGSALRMDGTSRRNTKSKNRRLGDPPEATA